MTLKSLKFLDVLDEAAKTCPSGDMSPRAGSIVYLAFTQFPKDRREGCGASLHHHLAAVVDIVTFYSPA